MKMLNFICRILVALILLSTLGFKFSAAEESVYIFTTLGMEPWGRIGSGILELIACILLFIPRTKWLGATLSIAAMLGALVAHLSRLGIEVQGDGGYLFAEASAALILSLVVLWMERRNIPVISTLFPKKS